MSNKTNKTLRFSGSQKSEIFAALETKVGSKQDWKKENSECPYKSCCRDYEDSCHKNCEAYKLLEGGMEFFE